MVKFKRINNTGIADLQRRVEPHTIVLDKENNVVYEVYEFFGKKEVSPIWIGRILNKRGEELIDAEDIFNFLRTKIGGRHVVKR